ncbi:MAG: hypothetical protein AAB229_06010 [Candidatus Hydrogenedentota bacterium]
MNDRQQKMSLFLDKLWNNPAISRKPVRKKEREILNFIRENQASLQKVFSSPDYFPGESWNDSVALLLSLLVEKVLDSLAPQIDRIGQGLLQSGVIAHFDSKAGVDARCFGEFLTGLMRTRILRDQYHIVIETITLDLFRRYMPPAIVQRKTIYNEIVRRERLDLDANLIPEFMNAASLFRPLYYHRIPYKKDLPDLVSLHEARLDRKLYDTAVHAMKDYIRERVGQVPECIYLPGLESCLDASAQPDIAGASKLINIMVNRCEAYDPDVKPDRGAESPDKSWFNINRRDAREFGYDARMLDELYQIAGDEGW